MDDPAAIAAGSSIGLFNRIAMRAAW